MITYTVKVDDEGNRYWYVGDKRHRLDGPAIEYADGIKYWYVDDKLHRLDGPAYEGVDGNKAWFVDGKGLTEAEFNKRTKAVSCAGKIVEIDGKKYKLIDA